jgi:hypothetical protein
MSTFKIDDEMKLKSWDDIINRPGYSSKVKPEICYYLDISAIYCFTDDEAVCGVSDCLKRHKQGFLVDILNDKETNICETCGERIFQTNIKKMKSVLKSSARIREQKIQLNTLLLQDNIKTRINDLKVAPKGANWLYRVFTSYCNTYPLELILALKQLAKQKKANDTQKNLTEGHIDYSNINDIEDIQGLNIFNWDIRTELIGKILKPLMELQSLTKETNKKFSLTPYCKWADELEEQFNHVEKIIKEGQLFFTKWNLERIKKIPLSKESEHQIKKISWSIEKANKR